MSYDHWRAQFKNDEKAAKAAFQQLLDLTDEISDMRRQISELGVAYNGMKAQRDQAVAIAKEAYGWLDADTFDLLRDLLHGQIGYPEMYTTCDKLRVILERVFDLEYKNERKT